MPRIECTFSIPKAFEALREPYRHKAFHGGRGAAKSRSFATALIERATVKKTRGLCAREIQRSIKDSVKALLDQTIHESGAGDLWRSTENELRGPHGSLITFAGLRSNPEQIKSTEGIDVAWIEEANTVSRRSLDLLIPTVRSNDSELWYSWNPVSELDPVDVMFRSKVPPPKSYVRQVNYPDNPFFPAVLEQERLHDLATDPEKHAHVWLGAYKKAHEGAYYADQLAAALADGRIGSVPHDPAAEVVCAFDLGIGDSTAVWFAQRVGREVHVIDYLEESGKGLEWYARELRGRPYTYAPLVLPHDGRARELGTGKSRQETLEGLGFATTICERLPAEDGRQAVRLMLPRCWFDERKCSDGLRALREHHERWDEQRLVSLGAEHDWSSHGADAFRYLAVAWKEKGETAEFPKEFAPRVQYGFTGAQGWMG